MNSFTKAVQNKPRINLFPIKLHIELFLDNKTNKYEIQIDKDMKFSELIIFIQKGILSDKIKMDKFQFKYYIQNQAINDNEQKRMSELNLLNNSVLQVSMVEAGQFKFNIITKHKTFGFDLKCGLATKSQDFENLVKERIFELSGLRAKVDYVDRLIYQVRQTIHLGRYEQPFTDLMMTNSTFDVILALIDKNQN